MCTVFRVDSESRAVCIQYLGLSLSVGQCEYNDWGRL